MSVTRQTKPHSYWTRMPLQYQSLRSSSIPLVHGSYKLFLHSVVIWRLEQSMDDYVDKRDTFYKLLTSLAHLVCSISLTTTSANLGRCTLHPAIYGKTMVNVILLAFLSLSVKTHTSSSKLSTSGRLNSYQN